ncbi:unnamed protein product [Rhizoctonia solani]|uniref:RING-type domain-containing protein n=1 Tax=Rhizoctonia solani TaxID=456999 RepID=A0A8H2XE41_9AGAM|nr:unnamed protein product [Rhizoctonia solani]
MADNHEDPPWLRPAPILVVSRDTDEKKNPHISITPAPLNLQSTLLPITARNSDMGLKPPLLPSPAISSPALSPPTISEQEEEYVGWKPQQITVRQVALTPPLSPLDLAMYPGVKAPPTADPVAARRAVTGLKPLRILSTRRPGGPASAGPGRPSSVEAMPGYAFSGFVGFFSSAAKRASTAVASEPPASSRASIQSISVAHTPIPVSPLPSPKTPPLVPKPSLAPELLNQMEPELKAHLDALAVQAAAGPSSSASSRPVSASKPPQHIPIEEEELELEIRDLTTGEIIKIRDLDAMPLTSGANRESQSTSQRSPSISDLMVVRDLDAQPRTPPLPRSQQRGKTPESRPPTPPRSSSPIESHSLAPPMTPDSQPQQGLPVSPLTEAVHVNRNLELSLSNLEDALSVARKSRHSPPLSYISRRGDLSRVRAASPQTTRTASSLRSSTFSSRMTGTPLTTPPASPPLPQRSKYVSLPCSVCVRPMQHMTSTRCGHVFCRGCIEGRSQCPVCRDLMEDSELRAIYLVV